MSGRSQEPKPLRVPRSTANESACKSVSKSVKRRVSSRKIARIQKQAQADPILLARPTSVESMATSVVSLMMLADDSGAARKIGIEYTAAATAALARMIAGRSGDDD